MRAVREDFERAKEAASAPATDESSSAAVKAPSDGVVAARTGKLATVGVKECDAYLERMLACARQMRPEAAGPMINSLATMAEAWRDAASTTDGRVGLASGCREARAASKAAYQSLCSF